MIWLGHGTLHYTYKIDSESHAWTPSRSLWQRHPYHFHRGYRRRSPDANLEGAVCDELCRTVEKAGEGVVVWTTKSIQKSG